MGNSTELRNLVVMTLAFVFLAIAALGGNVATTQMSGRTAARTSEPKLVPARNGAVDGAVELSADRDGHYWATVFINGRPIQAMIDTGASHVALSWKDAVDVGIKPAARAFTMYVSTANGVAKVAPVQLETVAIGNVVINDVRASVTESGKMDTTLIGMSFINRVRHVELGQGRLRLEQ